MSSPEESQKLLALAVDDERHSVELLERCLQSNPHIAHVHKALDASEALRYISADDEEARQRREQGRPPVDVVFADLEMPGLSGMEMARVFHALQPAPLLVFVTGYGDEAVQAFDLGAVDYLLKPYNQDRLDKSVDRVRAVLEPRTAPETENGLGPADSEIIPVELAGTTKLIPRSTVRWVEAHGDYARLHTAEGSYLARIPLTQLEENWSAAGFVRVHRSYLVALREITELRMSQGTYQVVVGDAATVLPVSRRNARQLKDRITRREG